MAIISNIQKYSIHDGDGIRTTVFFKGCPLHCKWCHNPETLSEEKEVLVHVERCTGCGECKRLCARECDVCGECTDVCTKNAREIVGREYSVKELIRELKKDMLFYEQSGGGVTLSGGEVMITKIEYLKQLVKQAYNIGISVNIDTCGYAPYESFKEILPYVDCFLYDIKLMQPQMHEKFTGVDNALILENLVKLSVDGANIHIRIPMMKEVNATQENIEQVRNFLVENKINVNKIFLLPYHNIGSGKYAKLGLDSEEFTAPTQIELEEFAQILSSSGYKVQIGG